MNFQLLQLLFITLITILNSPSLCYSSSSQAYPSLYSDTISSCEEPHTNPSSSPPQRREVFGNGKIIDITHKYRETLPAYQQPGGLGKYIWPHERIKNGSLINVSEFKLTTHSGTHVDAPGHVFDHYFDQGFDVDSLDLEILNGPALLVDVPRNMNITAEVMESLNIPRGVRRVLFRTLNTDRRLMWNSEFDTSFVGFMEDGAKWLVENTDIQLVGIDYLSVAAWDDLLPTHYVLLQSKEIIIVEGLKLDDIIRGIYSVHCLPLRLPTDGSPIRCILIN
ncbi:Cyclase-like protein 3 [Ranunculus cassubicifolius]